MITTSRADYLDDQDRLVVALKESGITVYGRGWAHRDHNTRKPHVLRLYVQADTRNDGKVRQAINRAVWGTPFKVLKVQDFGKEPKLKYKWLIKLLWNG